MQSQPPMHSNKAPSTTPLASQSNQSAELNSTETIQLRGVFANPTLPITPAQILQLQRTIGNRATTQLLKTQSQPAIPIDSDIKPQWVEERARPPLQLKNGNFVKEKQANDQTIQRVIVNKREDPLSEDEIVELYEKYKEKYEHLKTKFKYKTPEQFREKFNELNKKGGKRSPHTLNMRDGELYAFPFVDRVERKERRVEKKVKQNRDRWKMEPTAFLKRSKELETGADVVMSPLSLDLHKHIVVEAIKGKHAAAIPLDTYFGEEEETDTEEEKAVDEKEDKGGSTPPKTPKVYVDGERGVDIMEIRDDYITKMCAGEAKWYKGRDDVIAAVIPSSTAIIEFGVKGNCFEKNDIAKYLCLRYAIINVPAQARSGIARAENDVADVRDGEGKEVKADRTRRPAENEAKYKAKGLGGLHAVGSTGAAPPKSVIRGTGTPVRASDRSRSEPEFKAIRSGNQITVTIKHEGPWAKGDRGSGQANVMEGQNAKNHVIDAKYPKVKTDEQKEILRKKEPGRYEWLHIVGSSLGGLNVPNNLVAGSYDMNTKMIALEHKIALWGRPETGAARDGEEKIRPSPEKPIIITGEAKVMKKGSNIGETIKLTVAHGGTNIISRDYNVQDHNLLFKSEYKDEEKKIQDEIEAKKRELAARRKQ
jgi:hypothetical protein